MIHSHPTERIYLLGVSVDSHTSPYHLAVCVKQSKTNPFGACMTIHMGITADILCSVRAVLGDLAIRLAILGPLFLFKGGSILCRSHLIQSLHEALHMVGVYDSEISGHSFHIGVATMAAKTGLNDSLIRILGLEVISILNLYQYPMAEYSNSVSYTCDISYTHRQSLNYIYIYCLCFIWHESMCFNFG